MNLLLLAAAVASVPGATDPAVTQANIASTICVAGYSAKVRPPVGYTNRLKLKKMHTLGLTGSPADYELDHLIPLSIGGAPASADNLWPQLWAGPRGAKVKDRLEVKLHTLVCSHKVTLAAAQKAIRTDWTAAYRKYVGVLK